MNLEQLEKLERISKLKEQGVLTEEEFNQEKAKILAEDDTGTQNQYTDNSVSVPNTPEKSLLAHTFSFQGRANRKEFGIFFALYLLFSIILMNTIGFNLVTIVIVWILFITIIAATVRRLHDINLSGWWVCIIFLGSLNRLIPELYPVILGILFVLFLIVMFHPGHPQRNKYGPVPDSTEIEKDENSKSEK